MRNKYQRLETKIVKLPKGRIFDEYVKYKMRYNAICTFIYWLYIISTIASLYHVLIAGSGETQSFYFYIDLKWCVFLSGVLYFVLVNIYDLPKNDKYLGLNYFWQFIIVGIFYAYTLLYFNPIVEYNFTKERWVVLDIIAIVTILGSYPITRRFYVDKQEHCRLTGVKLYRENPELDIDFDEIDDA